MFSIGAKITLTLTKGFNKDGLSSSQTEVTAPVLSHGQPEVIKINY